MGTFPLELRYVPVELWYVHVELEVEREETALGIHLLSEDAGDMERGLHKLTILVLCMMRQCVRRVWGNGVSPCSGGRGRKGEGE